MSKKTEHTTIRNKKLFCLNCGGEFALPFPIPVDVMTKKLKAFNLLHKDCKATWKEPEVDQDKSVQEKMMFWLAQGERGISSEVMFQKLSGQDLGQPHPSPPRDPDDFRRCYLLLKTIPEWKTELHKLKNLSAVWTNLVNNWDMLTKMLEEQMETKKTNDMYQVMKAFGC